MKAKAFAPATVANVAVGFDILGFALKGLGETATVELIPKSRDVILEPIEGYPDLSLNPRKNTATAGLIQLIRDKKLNHGFRVSLQKTIPVGSGMGGSSTSAVASIVAANALLETSLSNRELLHYALIGEEVASGAQHGDNIAPCLLGGLVYVHAKSKNSWHTVPIKTPKGLHCVVLLPDVRINTREARSILKADVPLKSMIQQTANLTGVLLGCMTNDFDLIRDSLADHVIESQRAANIPSFQEFKKVALQNQALGCSISGSGPAIFAWTENLKAAEKLKSEWLKSAKRNRVPVVGAWTSPIERKGARVLKKVSR